MVSVINSTTSVGTGNSNSSQIADIQKQITACEKQLKALLDTGSSSTSSLDSGVSGTSAQIQLLTMEHAMLQARMFQLNNAANTLPQASSTSNTSGGLFSNSSDHQIGMTINTTV